MPTPCPGTLNHTIPHFSIIASRDMAMGAIADRVLGAAAVSMLHMVLAVIGGAQRAGYHSAGYHIRFIMYMRWGV